MTEEYNKWSHIATDVALQRREEFKICRDCNGLYHIPTKTWTLYIVSDERVRFYGKTTTCSGEQRLRCLLEGRLEKNE